jgi:hypothetical protein
MRLRPSNGELAAAIPHFLLEIVLRRSGQIHRTPAQLYNLNLTIRFNIGARSKSPEPRHPTISPPTYKRAERQGIKRRGAHKTEAPHETHAHISTFEVWASETCDSGQAVGRRRLSSSTLNMAVASNFLMVSMSSSTNF